MTKACIVDAPVQLCGRVLKSVLLPALLVTSFAGAAQAAVITFDGHTGTVNNGDTLQEAGYQVRFIVPDDTAPAGSIAVGQFVNPSDISVTCAGKVCPTDDASTFFDLFSSGYVDIVPATGSGTFSFTSLDASFIGMAGVDYPLTAGAIQVFGFNPGANPVTEQFNLAGPSNGQTSFQTFTASSDFASQQFAEIAVVGFLCDASGECTGLDNNGGEYALDNIMLSDQPVSNVPEPATAALLAAGLLGFGVRKRKRA